MTLVERMLKKFSPPLDSNLIISLTSGLADSIESELILLETLSNLIQETPESDIQPSTPTTHSDPTALNHDPNQSLIHQVQSIFPTLSRSPIQRAISNTSSDLNDIIDYLQAAEYEDQGHLSDTLQHRSTSAPAPSTRKIKKSQKNCTVHLNDVRQRGVQNQLKQAEKAQLPHQIDNAWVTGDSQIIYISNLLGINPQKIYSIYHSKACNLVLTLEDIFTELEFQKRGDIITNEEKSDQLKIQLDFLRTMLSDNNDEMLARLLIMTDLEPGKAYELWLFLDDLQNRHGTLTFNQFIFSNPSPHHHSSSGLADLKTQSSSHDSLVINRNCTTDSTSFLRLSQPTKVASTTDLKSNDSFQYSANHCWIKMNELKEQYERSKQSSRHTGILTGSSSSSCINKRHIQSCISLINQEKSQQILKQAKEWEYHLVQHVISERQRSHRDHNSIDLHGLTTNQATLITSQLLSSWWASVQSNAYSSNFEPFRIVTGAGTHSSDLKPRLLLCITRLLDQERWKYKSESNSSGSIGSLIVYGIKKKH